MDLISRRSCLNFLVANSPLLLALGLIFLLPAAHALEIMAIDFYQEGEISKLELSFDEEGVAAKRFHVVEDKQIILDISKVKGQERVLRAFDTSEFSGSVIFVSPYRRPGSQDDLRLALQLRENVRSLLEVKDKKLILSVENRFGVFDQKKIDKNQGIERDLAQGLVTSSILVPKSNSVEDILENLTQSGIKKYIGKKISFNVKDIAISDILKMLADSSGFNIIIHDDIKKLPNLTLALTNIPWDQALDTVLGLSKLVASKNGNILLVTTLEKATEEANMDAKAKELGQKKIPLVTKVFPISFAKVEDLKTLLMEYSTKDRGAISVDLRINALIVKDTVDVIDKMKKIIETLDAQTPQILIEAKIVEASENFAQDIGLKNGISFGYDPIGQSVGAAAAVGPGFSFSSAPVAGEGSRNLFQFGVQSFKRLQNLNLALQLMESESKGKIIASPKIITENKKPAVINSTETTSFKVVNSTNGQSQESYQSVSATLQLDVTPQVTNEGSIVLQVKLDKGSFSNRPTPDAPPNQTTRSMSTNVLVDNGSTVVIGGIYTFSKLDSNSGIPFVKDLPLVGWLFRSSYNPQTQKNELLIFITPRIINQEEAGLVERDEAVL